MKTKKDPFFSAINSLGSEFDYQLAGGDQWELPTPRFTFDDHEIQYHQPDVSKYSCTVFAAMGAVSDLLGFKFDEIAQMTAWDIALDQGADPNVGWYVHKAVDVVRKMCNMLLSPSKHLMTFQVALNSEQFFKALDQGYSVVTGYSGNKKYNLDIADGVLDNVSFGPRAFGHCVRVVKRGDDYDVVVDNYSKSKTKKNIYRIDRDKFHLLLRNGVFFRYGYIFVVKRDFNKKVTLGEIPLWGVATVEKCIELGIKEDWSDWDEPLSIDSEKIEDMLIKLGVLEKRLGSLTVLRFYIAMDRLGHIAKM